MNTVRTDIYIIPSLVLLGASLLALPVAAQTHPVTMIDSTNTMIESQQMEGGSASNPFINFHVSDWLGADVYAWRSKDSLGQISDLVLGNDGQITGVLVASGGFLNMNRKHVYVGWENITNSMSKNDVIFRIKMDKNEFKKLASHERK